MAMAVVALHTKPSSFIRAIVNSLFDGGFICPRPANPMNFRHFWWELWRGMMKIPVIFPVSREFGARNRRGCDYQSAIHRMGSISRGAA
jgi:hypothetical protein